MKREHTITARSQTDTGAEQTTTIQTREDSAAQFVTKFTNHFLRCKTLAKRFAVDNSELKDSAALSQLCRASQEMLEQAKEARAMTEIYLALDDKYRDAVRPIIIARFRDISKSAQTSWRRFCDSTRFAPAARREIESAQRDFEPHANEFHKTLRMFIALGDEVYRQPTADRAD
jgi:hypothetical protein